MPCDPLQPIGYLLVGVVLAIAVPMALLAVGQMAWSILQVFAVTIGACR